MGLALNNHKAFLPTDRAKAEAIASVKLLSVSKLFAAGSQLDEAGRAYWAGETDSFAPAIQGSVTLMVEARDLLTDMIQDELDLNPRIAKSEKEVKCIELGLDNDDNSAGRMTARSVQRAQRLVAGVNHVLASRDQIDTAAAEVSLEKMYALMSAPFRHILEEASEYMACATADARATHEMASIVEEAWVREGRQENKRAHLTGEPMFSTPSTA